MYIYVCIYIYIYIHTYVHIHVYAIRRFLAEAPVLAPCRGVGVGGLGSGNEEALTDGIGTPDPNPRNLVNWYF